MGKDTKIEWADASWSPWWGCTKVGPGCTNCYAEAMAKRWGWDVFGKGKDRRRYSPAYWKKPLKWDVATPGMSVFPSLCDPFDPEVPTAWFGDFLALIAATPNLKWLLLTKRPSKIRLRLKQVVEFYHAEDDDIRHIMAADWLRGSPPRNVAIGVSAENQEAWDDLVPALLNIPAAMRFVSAEPLLWQIDPRSPRLKGSILENLMPVIDWVIIGGESGPNFRCMQIDWMERLATACHQANIPCFIKQDSNRHPGRQGLIPDKLWERKEKPEWLSKEVLKL